MGSKPGFRSLLSTAWGCEKAVTMASLRRQLVRAWNVKCPQRPTHQRLRLHGGAINRWCNLWLELSRVSLDHSRTASEWTVRAWSLPFLLLPGHKVSRSLCQAFFPYLCHQAYFPKHKSNESTYKPFLFIS